MYLFFVYFRTQKEDFLKNLARDNTQLVVNKLYDLDKVEEDGLTLVALPAPTYRLPRAKPCPRPKPPTKWEQFAKEKGIQHKKKEKLVWDEVSKEWKPRFGYHGINQNSDQWVIEVPDNADPNTDFFDKQTEEKKERVAKNELQRLRNIARSSKMKLPGTAGIVPNVDLNKDQLAKARVLAKESTASLGKFAEDLPDEKPAKNMGKKRKFESNLDNMQEEKDRNLELASQILANQVQKIDASEEDKVLSK